MPLSRARGPKAASDTGEPPKRRSRFPSRSVLPIFFTDISEFSVFWPTAWRTVSSCCWSRGYWSTGSSASTTSGCASVFEERLTEITGEIIEHRREEVGDALDALRRQYPDYVAALEVRFLRQSALRQEMGRYQALFEEGLIPQELYDDLKRGVAGTPRRRAAAPLRNRLGYASPDRAAGHPVGPRRAAAGARGQAVAAAVYRAERAHHTPRETGATLSSLLRPGQSR